MTGAGVKDGIIQLNRPVAAVREREGVFAGAIAGLNQPIRPTHFTEGFPFGGLQTSTV
jgi:hypothetical protein